MKLKHSIDAPNGRHSCCLNFWEEDKIDIQTLFVSGKHRVVFEGDKEAMLRLAFQFSACHKSLRDHMAEFYSEDGLSLPILNKE